ncbi:MAG: glycosyltransferase [Candidatus Binatia bacterium]
MSFPLRLLVLIDELDIGGTEQQIFELVKRLDRRKYLPMVCCFRSGRVAKEIEAIGVPVFTLKKRAKFDLALCLALVRLMRRERIDLVQTYLFTANTWARLAAILARVPLIVSSERNVDMWEERYKQILGRILDRWTYATVANSAAVKEYLVGKGIAPRKIRVIYNGVDPERFPANLSPHLLKTELGIPAHHQVVGLIARLEPAKDVHTFLHAAAIIAEQTADVSFLIVGGGSLQQDLERKAQQLGIADRVVFTGPRRDIPHLLAVCDISAMSSLKEGMSNTIMESMAAGKPMVATHVGGNPELIVDGETGFLIPTHAPAAFAAALNKILSAPTLARRMGEQARERISRLFSVNALVTSTEQLYDELAASLEPHQTVKSTNGTSRNEGNKEPQNHQIAFVVSQFPRYVDAYFLREVTALAARGIHFQIFSLQNFNGKVVHQDAQALLPQTVYLPFFFSLRLWRAHISFLTHTPKRYGRALWTIIRGCWRSPRSLLKALVVFPKSVYFAKLAQEQHLAHIHANWASHPAVSALTVSQLTDIPWSFAGHASDIFLDTTMLKEKIRAAKFVLTCTRYNKSYLAEIGGDDVTDKIIASYHGVDLRKFVPVRKSMADHFRILSVGTLLPCKGLPDLLEACRLLASRSVPFHCTIAGDGPERQALEEQIQRSGLAGQVEILGYVSQETLIPLYQQSDVVALPALSESHFGIPNVLLEALAVKTPVVCTPLPSLSEVIEDGQQGLYVPERSPAALADALEKLASHPEFRQTMGEAGRKAIEKLFDTEHNVATLEALFHPTPERSPHGSVPATSPSLVVSAPKNGALT